MNPPAAALAPPPVRVRPVVVESQDGGGEPRRPPGGRLLLEVVVVIGYLGVFAAALLRMAAAKAYWFDELFTLHLARSPGALWANLAAGVDLNPPLHHWLTSLAVALFGEAPWAVRLPAVLGGVAASGATYLFVRRRRGPGEGFLAMAGVGATAAVWYYFTEARPYGPMLGFAGLALVGWQRAAEGGPGRRWWAAGFAAAGACGVATHYYFVVPLAALAVAEAVRTLGTRKPDRAVLAGFAAAGLTLAALYPLWGHGPRAFAPGFWAKVPLTAGAVCDTYHKLCPADLGPPLLLALAAAAVAGGFQSERRGSSPPAGYRPWELAAVLALAAGPVVGVVVGAKVAGAFFHRYCVPTAIGLAALFALAVARTAGGRGWACGLAAVGVMYFGVVGHWWAGPRYFRADARQAAELADWLDAHAAGGAVVFDSAFEFGRAWHDAPGRRFAPRFAADPALALQHTRADTIDRGLLALRRAADVPVDTFADVAAAAGPVYFYGPADGWRAKELAARGRRFEPVARRDGGTLYRLLR